MLAVIELGWNQFTVRVWDVIEVKKQDAEVESILTTQALLLANEDGSETKIGTPLVESSKIELKVLKQFAWDKVRVFKMKSKKRYMRNRWFRPLITKLEVMSIA